ncbi:MAG: PQQ-binding-like beta-propeller repeat protein [Anaerolineae bacterium]|nr:PQQ-binding-like beta-propeller repeat protein [Anaerolineae bacterium]
MNTSRLFPSRSRLLLGVLLLSALLLAACGGPTQESWIGVSTDEQQDTLYVSQGKRVVAINPVSGAVLWEYEDERATFYAVPTVVDGTVYVGDYSGRMHAVDANGQRVWRYQPAKQAILGPIEVAPKDRVIGGAAVDSDKVFFGLGSRNVAAVSRTDGQEVWTFTTEHGVWARPLYVADDPSNGNRAVVYVTSLDHNLYALDAETGDELWHKNLGGAAPGNLVYDAARQRVYVGTFVSELLAVDLKSHDIVARFKTDGWLWGSPAFDDDVLYFGDLSGALYAVRVTESGFEQVWKKPIAEEGIRATPILTDGLLIVASEDHNVYAVSKEDGASRWYRDVKAQVLADLVFVPAAAGDEQEAGLVIVSTTEGDRLVVALAATSGEERWVYPG